LIGRTIAHYEIVEQLGRGGMGVVYRARDTRLNRFVALKFLPPRESVSRDARTRFMREAQAASALDHANICTIHEIGETDDGEQYIAMGLYEGRTLRAMLDEGPLDLDQAVAITRQLADALSCAHEAGIAHRDLKPENLVITTRGELKLLDFGLAKLADATRLTQAGTTLGTVHYMSPEQADARESDERSDIWSLGVILSEMLTGQRPFGGESPAAIMMSILSKDPSPLPSSVPQAIAAVVHDCLQREPEARPRAAEILLRLGGSTPAVSNSVSRRWLPASIVALAIVIAGSAWWVGRDGSSAPPPRLELDEELVAIAPFQVRGASEFEYLREGMVDLMSAKLAGAGELRAVNPRRIVSLSREMSDEDAGARLAAATRAGLFVTGEVVEAGGQIQVTARLSRTDEPGAPLAQVSETDGAEDLFALVDRVAAELLAGTLVAGAEGLPDLASATTKSLPALRAYLDGERLMRMGLYREAASAYDQAVAADSTFALGYYRKSVAADWIDGPDIRESAERAAALAADLPQPERNLVVALSARRRGDSDEAERMYRSILFHHPEHVETIVQLAELVFHDHPRSGRPMKESAALFRRVVDLEPDNLIAQVHLARMCALDENLDELESIVSHLQETAGDSERFVEVEAMAAFLAGDQARIERLGDSLAGKPWHFTWYAMHSSMRYARDAAGAMSLLGDNRDEALLLRMTIPALFAAQGRYRELRSYMGEQHAMQNPTWDLYEVFLLTSGAVPSEPDRLAAATERLARADAARLLSTSPLPPYFDITESVVGFERDYFVALGLIQLGRVEEARPLIAGLEQRGPFPGMASLHSDAVAGLEAEILYQEGNHSAALEVIRTVRCDAPHAATPRPISDAARSRLLRAELELELGDIETARSYYLAFDQSWSPWDSIQRSVAFQALAKIAEDRGDFETAALWYERLVDAWANADPELVELREFASAEARRLRELP
jgi:tetratricopeptide (TPR) repeat protein